MASSRPSHDRQALDAEPLPESRMVDRESLGTSQSLSGVMSAMPLEEQTSTSSGDGWIVAIETLKSSLSDGRILIRSLSAPPIGPSTPLATSSFSLEDAPIYAPSLADNADA